MLSPLSWFIRLISSSRKQEGYKRWKATSSGKEEKTTKVKWEHGAWLRHALGETVPRAQYVQKFDESAVVWCANLLGVETARLKEILRDVSGTLPGVLDEKKKGRLSDDFCFLTKNYNLFKPLLILEYYHL